MIPRLEGWMAYAPTRPQVHTSTLTHPDQQVLACMYYRMIQKYTIIRIALDENVIKTRFYVESISIGETGRAMATILPSWLAEFCQDRINILKGLIYLISDLGSRQDNLATDKNKQHDLWLHHPVNKTWKQFRLVTRVVSMRERKPFQSNRELYITGAHNILNFEFRKACRKAQLLDDASIFACSQTTKLFTLGTSDDHLARSKDEGRRLGLSNAHNDGRETLEA